MFCLDTSSLIAYLDGSSGSDVEVVDRALQERVGFIAPVTLSELLSDPSLSRSIREIILALPVLPLIDGYWERAGLMRAKILRAGHKAKLADTLITQSCLDHRATLVARDQDFRIFEKLTKLKFLEKN